MQHGWRAGRAANDCAVEPTEAQPASLHVAQQHLPHGGHPGGHGHAFGFNQVIDGFAIHCRAGKHQLAARGRCAVRQAPGIDVEHGHHGQDGIAGADVERIGQRTGIGMQQGGTVAVEHALGIAGGAAGVTEAGGGVFVELRPGVGAGLGSNQRLVADEVGYARPFRQLVGITQGHPQFDAGAFGLHGGHQRREGGVKAHHAVFGVVDDPGQLLGMQAGVEGVQHPARTADTVVHLQVAVTVPGNAGHPVGKGQPLCIQCIGKLPGSAGDRAPLRAVDVALNPAGNNFTLAMVPLGVLNQRRNQQRMVLHQTQHDKSPWLCASHGCEGGQNHNAW